MKTILQLDDDVLGAARSLARSEKKALGAVVSELARTGLEHRPMVHSEADFPTFEVTRGAPTLTPEMVRRALEEEG